MTSLVQKLRKKHHNNIHE